VVGAFIPDDINEWDEGKEHWVFYPFLVIIESLNKDEPGHQVWLPYWHKITKDDKVRTPYGRGAACLEIDNFQQLLKKAKKKGFFKD
jgi:hypothetical protein